MQKPFSSEKKYIYVFFYLFERKFCCCIFLFGIFRTRFLIEIHSGGKKKCSCVPPFYLAEETARSEHASVGPFLCISRSLYMQGPLARLMSNAGSFALRYRWLHAWPQLAAIRWVHYSLSQLSQEDAQVAQSCSKSALHSAGAQATRTQLNLDPIISSARSTHVCVLPYQTEFADVFRCMRMQEMSKRTTLLLTFCESSTVMLQFWSVQPH